MKNVHWNLCLCRFFSLFLYKGLKHLFYHCSIHTHAEKNRKNICTLLSLWLSSIYFIIYFIFKNVVFVSVELIIWLFTGASILFSKSFASTAIKTHETSVCDTKFKSLSRDMDKPHIFCRRQSNANFRFQNPLKNSLSAAHPHSYLIFIRI